jgi:hypothetical protein
MSQNEWVEPRGPHLPDVITRIPLGVWPFLAVAVLAAYGRVSLLRPETFESPVNALWVLVGSVDAVVAPLLGAALFYRHPRAHRTLPAVAFGAILFAFTTVVDALREPVMNSIAPPMFFGSLDDTMVTLAGSGYRVIEALLVVFALTYLALGLDDARQNDDRTRARSMLVALAALAIGGPLISAFVAWPWPGEFALQIVLNLGAGALTNLAWLYLGVTVYRGWAAGETPDAGWGLAAVASVGYLAVVAVFSVLNIMLWIIGPTESQVPVVYEAALLLEALAAALWVAFLVAFWLGLPAEPDPSTPDLAEGPLTGSAGS